MAQSRKNTYTIRAVTLGLLQLLKKTGSIIG